MLRKCLKYATSRCNDVVKFYFFEEINHIKSNQIAYLSFLPNKNPLFSHKWRYFLNFQYFSVNSQFPRLCAYDRWTKLSLAIQEKQFMTIRTNIRCEIVWKMAKIDEKLPFFDIFHISPNISHSGCKFLPSFWLVSCS